MRSSRKQATVLAAACSLLVLAACGETSGPAGEAQNFTGTYTLVSFSQGTENLFEFDDASGNFTMTATSYEATFTIPPLPTTTDHGTYSADGTTEAGDWSQQSTDNPDLQYAGTYAWDAATNRLTLDTSSQGIRSVLVFQRT